MIEGKITRVKFPKNFQSGNNDSNGQFAIVVVNNYYNVKGDIAVLDFILDYRFATVLREDKQYGPTYVILSHSVAMRKKIQQVDILIPPLTLNLFGLLFRTYGYSAGEVESIVETFQNAIHRIDNIPLTVDVSLDRVVSLQSLRQYFLVNNTAMSARLERLMNEAHYFKAESMKKLSLFWSAEELAVLSTATLFQIVESLNRSPWPFCFRWLNEFEGVLSELTPAHLWHWRMEYISFHKFTLDALTIPYDDMVRVVTMYNKFKKQVKSTAQLRISALKLKFDVHECLALPFACRQGIFKVFPNLDIVLADTYVKMESLGNQINQLKTLHSVISGPPRRLSRERVAGFSHEQMIAVNRILKGETRVLMVGGEAGTGKTHVFAAIHSLFHPAFVLSVAAYGRTAKKLKVILNENAYTIMMAIQCGLSKKFPADWKYKRRRRRRERLRRAVGGENGDVDEEEEEEDGEEEEDDTEIEYDTVGSDGGVDEEENFVRTGAGGRMVPWENIRVLMVEELGVVTSTLLQKLISFLPNLLYLIMFGDRNQMAPVEPDSIIHSFVKKYQGTVAYQEFTRNFRAETSPLSHLLIENFQKISRGESNIRYTTNIRELNEIPFLVVVRTDPTMEQLRSTAKKSTERRRLIDACIEKDMRFIIQNFGNRKSQIITQKNVVRHQINSVVFRMDPRYRNQIESLDGGRPKTNMFLIGEKVVFLKNYYQRRETKGLEEHLKSAPVFRGEMRILTAIEDYNINETDPTRFISKTNTIQDKMLGHYRMLVFDDGARVNTSFYPLFNISKGYACTTASEQGEEIDVIIIYVELDFCYYLTRSVFYTAVTRAREIVVIVCNPAVDLEKIISTTPPSPNYELAEFLI